MSEQPITTPAGDTLVWSRNQMITRLGGDEALARQLVTLFIEERPRMMSQLRAYDASR